MLNNICLKTLAEVHIWMNSLYVLKESREFFVNNLLVAKKKNQKLLYVICIDRYDNSKSNIPPSLTALV